MKHVLVYIRYLTNGDIQAGVRCSNLTDGGPRDNGWSARALACVDVYLSELAPKRMESVHQVVDEAFARIGSPSL